MKEVTATAILVKMSDGTYRLGDETDITIGIPCLLLLPNGQIVRTSNVTEWRKYGSFYVKTMHTKYSINCDNIHP